MTITGATGLQGFHFVYPPHPEKDQKFVSDAMNDCGHLSIDNNATAGTLFEDAVSKQKLADNELALSWDTYW